MLGAQLVFVVVLVVTGVVALPRADSPKPFTLEEVLDGTFSARGLNAVWATDKELARLTSNGIELYDVDTNETKQLVNMNLLETGIGTWKLSSDLSKLLYSYNVKKGFRHSSEAKYAVIDIQEKLRHNITNAETQDFLQNVQLVPKGNGVVYVAGNNIYYIEDIFGSNEPKAITEDGTSLIYNGVSDWVYEEEVLSSGSAMWISPDGTYLAYARFDDTKVHQFSYIKYGEEQYSSVEKLNYPKPGTENPTVIIKVVKLKDSTGSPDIVTNAFDEPILQHLTWTSDRKFIAVWLNRIQNEVIMESYSLETSETKDTWKPKQKQEFSDTMLNGWFDIGSPYAVNDSTWVMLLPRELKTNEERFQMPTIFKDGTNNIVNIVNKKMTATNIYGWDTKSKRIFFQAAPEDHPEQRHVYSVSEDGTDLQCLSCSLSQPFKGGTSCLYATATFSTDFSRAAVTCSGPAPAAVAIAKVASGRVEWQNYWQRNEALLDMLEQRLLPKVEPNISFAVGEGYSAKARLWLPPGLDESKKYPMLVYVYGGPGSQQVSEQFSVNWGYYLTTAKNIIYASIDGRGSGYQGTKNMFALYRQLGTVEVEDQIGVTKQLLQKYPFIDARRVAIWGWSYGGYATAMTLAKDDEGVFACGASVAPVTSWDLYDSIYTERYMSTLEDNRKGYEAANVSNKIKNFKTHQFYLLHGNADDNVHYQQSMRLTRALEESQVLFEQQSYPDESHSITSLVNHVYLSLEAFFDRCFDVEDGTNSAETSLPHLLPALLLPLCAVLLS